MPFYSTGWFDSGNGWESEGERMGTYQIPLGTFSPEELKSVGKLEIKVGHMKKGQFTD